MSELLGVFGGTFSPPHLGHRHAAEVFLNLVKPDHLLIVPTYLPPHKTETDGVTPRDRYEMCRLAFSDLPNTDVSDMEIRRTGKSYTSDTLRELKRENRTIALLIGTDMMLSLDTWHEPQTLFNLCRLYCIRREDDSENTRRIQEKNKEYFRRFGQSVTMLPASPITVSSTDVRRQLAVRGESADIAPAVMSYILERGLYANSSYTG